MLLKVIAVKNAYFATNFILANGFKLNSVCNDTHDLKILGLNFSDIDIITVKLVYYRWIFMTLGNLKQFMY